MINKLRALLTRRDKILIVYLLIFSVFVSIVEAVGISVILPFISVASDFSIIEKNEYYSTIYTFLGFESTQMFVISFGVALIIFYLFRGGINILYVYSLSRFAQGRFYLIAFRLFQNYMGYSYHDFVKQNSGNLTKNITTEAAGITKAISGVMTMLSEVMVVILLYSMMLYTNAKITLLLTCILLINALLMTLTVSKRIKKAGSDRAMHNRSLFEVIGSSFGNFKIIKLLSNEDKIMQQFSNATQGVARANVINNTLNQVPRMVLEGIGFSLIALIVIYLVIKYNSDIQTVIPVISMFVVALYRMLPSVNRILSGYNQLMFSNRSLEIIHNDLMFDIETLGSKEIDFKRLIEVKQLDFSYAENKPVLQDINLCINKGQKVAFVGESGSGKSTLVDIVIGLYKPLRGKVLVDGQNIDDDHVKSWREKVGYIPQSVYLFDGTVTDNVVMGRQYDENKIIETLEKANIWEFLKSKDGLQTKVGEGGIQLSGGQKQRVAIARALYGEPEILVLDEATSALDSKTEELIMEEIYNASQGKTLIVIAHRISTIERCDVVYEIKNMKVKLR